jgi:hypothetical protein
MKLRYSITSFILLSILSIPGWKLAAQTTTFNYTGGVQYYTVPSCVTSLVVDVEGAAGGSSAYSAGGNGGQLICTLAVNTGAVLAIYVGGRGNDATTSAAGTGGFNGGAAGAWRRYYYFYSGGGGGGASDIRQLPYSLSDRIAVAGGGGGGGNDCPYTDSDRGGDGGGLTGGDGYYCSSVPGGVAAGKGATSLAAGAGGSYPTWIPGNNGTFGSGGDCGISGASNSTGGGGGGGGWFGGGGGSWSGGGGGSAYANPFLASSVAHTPGYNTGAGIVTVTPSPCNPAGVIETDTFAVCAGAAIQLYDTTTVPCGTWSSSNIAVAVADPVTGIVTGIAEGTAIITYNLAVPCGGIPATQTVTVNPSPAPLTGKTSVCTDTITNLIETFGYGNWFSSNPSIATVGLISGVVTGIAPGTAIITYILSTGCNVSTTVTVNVCTMGVGQAMPAGSYTAELFPNPVKDNLVVKMDEMSFHSCVITNGMGQILMQRQLHATQTDMDVKALPPGLYYIILSGDYGKAMLKFRKE